MEPIVVSVPAELGASGESQRSVQFRERYRERQASFWEAVKEVPAVAQVLTNLDTTKVYTIEWPPGIKEMVDAGKATWKELGDGTLEVVIRDENGGAIKKHLRLREATDPSALLNGLNNLAVQAALAEVMVVLGRIEGKVDALLDGQRHDRHGVIEGGIHQYEQAMAVSGERRAAMLQSALPLLNQGRGQLIRSVQARLDVIRPPTFWSMVTRVGGSPTEELSIAFDEITEDVAWIIRATEILVLVHDELHSRDAAAVSIRQLVNGIEGVAERCREAAPYARPKAGLLPEDIWHSVAGALPSARRSLDLLDADAITMEVTPEVFAMLELSDDQ